MTGNTRMKCQSFILQATSCEGYFFNRPTFSQSDIPFCIPLATSCGGYNVFDPSVRQSVSPVFLVSATPLKTAKQNFVKLSFVVMKDIMYRCAYFSRSYAIFELRNLTKMKVTIEAVCQRNSSKAAQQNFVNFCSYEGHNV